MKTISILGSTGSVGRSTLAVVAAQPDRFRVVALAAGRQVKLLAEQIARFAPRLASVEDADAASELRAAIPGGSTRVVSGRQGLMEVAAASGADLLVAALVGAVGLEPTYAALQAGTDVALANKETLVMAGQLMTAAARASGARLLPVDSEHAALHQLLGGVRGEDVERIILTASGGPFRLRPIAELRHVTLAEALKHPTWSMGAKITIDSATLANKGLEVIEAHWLFGYRAEVISVLVHPQSVIHGLVEMRDGSLLAQLGPTDMRLPIQYALSHPEMWPPAVGRLDLRRLGELSFEQPDTLRFPCLALAYQALAHGGAAPAIFNAANEVANSAFREGRLGFMGIPETVERALERTPSGSADTLEAVLEADRLARAEAVAAIGTDGAPAQA